MFGPILYAELTLQQLEEIREINFAEDIEIDLERMKNWSEEQAIEYFESAGAIDPDQRNNKIRAFTADLSNSDIYGGAHFDGRLTGLLEAALPPVATSGPVMPGEETGALRRCFVAKPQARIRLFVLYGVADVSMSTQRWIDNAPDWLEVRLIDLPGHGFRSKEALPACAERCEAGLDEAAVAEQRAALVDLLSAEVREAAAGAPYALFGFSFGALLAYGICVKLASEGTPPLQLCVAGRGSPDCATLSKATCDLICKFDAETMLSWQGNGASFTTAGIPGHMRERASTLFRCGMLLNAAPSGGGELSSPLLPGPAMEIGFAMEGENGFMTANASHVDGAPRVPTGCPILAIGSDVDSVWPNSLVQQWHRVAYDSDSKDEKATGEKATGEKATGEKATGLRSFVGKTLYGVQHNKLMLHEQTMAACFVECGVAAAHLARCTAASMWRGADGTPEKK